MINSPEDMAEFFIYIYYVYYVTKDISRYFY